MIISFEGQLLFYMRKEMRKRPSWKMMMMRKVVQPAITKFHRINLLKSLLKRKRRAQAVKRRRMIHQMK